METIQSHLDAILEELEKMHLESGIDRIMVDPNTAEAIRTIVTVRKAVDESEAIMKERLLKAATEYDGSFSGIEGRGVRVSFAASGAAYVVTDIDELEKNAAELVVKGLADAKTVRSYLKGAPVGIDGTPVLPAGMEENKNRKMSLRITLTKGEEEYDAE